jgi:hypothetical protein
MYATAGGYMKVQTCGDPCEGACVGEQHTKNTMEPGLSGPFLPSLMRTEKHSHWLVVLSVKKNVSLEVKFIY